MNKKRFYILASTLLLIGLTAGLIQYVGTFDTLYAFANNPGHLWSEMECNDTLCVDMANSKLEINSLKMNGEFYDADGSTGVAGSVLYKSQNGLKWDTLLTWPGSTHTTAECTRINGIIFDSGNGTICRVSAGPIPEGWTQAENWQKYASSSWGGDEKGYAKSSGPNMFSNVVSDCTSNSFIQKYHSSDISYSDNYWHAAPYWTWYLVTHVANCSINRLEVGVK